MKPSTGTSSTRAFGTTRIVPRAHTWNALAYIHALIISAAAGYLLMHVPFEVSDNLGNLIQIQSRSAWELFRDTLTLPGFMRPASWVTTNAVFEMAGGHYFLAYRTLHALMIALLLVALVRLVRVNSPLTFALSAIAAGAVIGFHPFHDAVRETELNMKLMLPLLCFAAVILADAEPRGWRNAAALAVFVYALLANELGIIVWVCLVSGYMVGLRGVSRNAVIAASVVLAFYFVLRFGPFEVGAPGLIERSSGFGFRARDPEELVAMFGDNPMPFYLYNVIASALTLLLSEPRAGVFVFARGVFSSSLDNGTVINVVTSLVTSAMLVWYTARRWRSWIARDFSHGDRLFIIGAGAVAANAAISYPYTKDVIMSIGAAFYPLAMFAALHLAVTTFMNQKTGVLRAIVLYAALAIISVGWTVRAASFAVDMRRSAYVAQQDWVDVYAWLYEQKILPEGERSALVDQLRAEMLSMQVPRVYLDPPWISRLDPH